MEFRAWDVVVAAMVVQVVKEGEWDVVAVDVRLVE